MDESLADIQFVELDEDGDGFVSSEMVARFMRRSQQPDATLSQIWQAANPQSLAKIDLATFRRVVQLLANPGLLTSSPPPTAASTPSPPAAAVPLLAPPPAASGTSLKRAPSSTMMAYQPTISAAERQRFDAFFMQLGAVNGAAPLDRVRPLLLRSNLPAATVDRIISIVGIDKDGRADAAQFAAAMKITSDIVNKVVSAPPPTLPESLRRASPPVVTSTVTSSSATVAAPAPTAPTSAFNVIANGLAGSSTPAFGVLWPSATSPPSTAGSAAPAAAPTAPLLRPTADDEAPPTPAELEHYMAVFYAERNVTLQGVTESAAYEHVVNQLGLSREEFARLWAVCHDGDVGSALDAGRFVALQHMAMRRRAGLAVPPVIPVSWLSAVAAKATTAPHMQNTTAFASTAPDLEFTARERALLKQLEEEERAAQGLETRCSLARERAELLRVHALDYDELLSLRRAQADEDRAHLAALNAHVGEQEREIARRQEARATADANAAQVAAIEERIRDAMSRARAF